MVGRASSSSIESPRGRLTGAGGRSGLELLVLARATAAPCPTSPDGIVVPAAPLDAPAGPPGGKVIPTLVMVRLRILNMWPQWVHFTVTPPGFRRASSSSYSV
jgi:hypothetical protein